MSDPDRVALHPLGKAATLSNAPATTSPLLSMRSAINRALVIYLSYPKTTNSRTSPAAAPDASVTLVPFVAVKSEPLINLMPFINT